MKAVGLYKHLPIEDPQSLVDLDIQEPNHPTGHDLLVATCGKNPDGCNNILSVVSHDPFYTSEWISVKPYF